MTVSGQTSRAAVPGRAAALARVCLVSAALQAWTSSPSAAEDGPHKAPQGFTPAIAAAVDAAKEGRLGDTLQELGKALVAARQRRDARLVEALEGRYRATWIDVGKLRRSAIQAACRCNPKEAEACHTQLERADLPDRLTSATSGATYDLHFPALQTLLSHVARFSGNGPLANDLSAIGNALDVARQHELNQVTPALTARYEILWEQVETLHRKAATAVGEPEAAHAETVLRQLDSAGLLDQVRNALHGNILSFSDLRASLRDAATDAKPLSSAGSAASQPRAELPVSKPNVQPPSAGAPAASQQPTREQDSLTGIWVTSTALAVVLAALATLLFCRRNKPKDDVETSLRVEDTGDAAVDPSSQRNGPAGK